MNGYCELFKQMINGCKGYKGTSGIETNSKFEYVVVVCYELNSGFEYERKPRIYEYKYSNINDAIKTYKEEMEPDDMLIGKKTVSFETRFVA